MFTTRFTEKGDFVNFSFENPSSQSPTHIYLKVLNVDQHCVLVQDINHMRAYMHKLVKLYEKDATTINDGSTTFEVNLRTGYVVRDQSAFAKLDTSVLKDLKGVLNMSQEPQEVQVKNTQLSDEFVQAIIRCIFAQPSRYYFYVANLKTTAAEYEIKLMHDFKDPSVEHYQRSPKVHIFSVESNKVKEHFKASMFPSRVFEFLLHAGITLLGTAAVYSVYSFGRSVFRK